jgi:Uma2 family endonuclease
MIRKFNPFTRNDYPTTDRRIMSETEWHLRVMHGVIFTLKRHFEPDPNVYVTGDMLVFWKPNDRRTHLSPDVFAVRGVRKDGERPNYLVWEERKFPELVIEITSETTRKNDLGNKLELYRDEWKVKEYFLFDPHEDYLEPSMQGFRLVDGDFVRIREKAGRLPSRVLGLHLERSGSELRFWNPSTDQWILTDREWAEQERRTAEQERLLADEARLLADEARLLADEARLLAERERQLKNQQASRADRAEAELAKLRSELQQLEAERRRDSQ